MKRSLSRVLAAAGALLAPAYASAAESPFALAAETAAHSDYRFRGVSLSNRNPALQADLSVEHRSGLYAGLWSSTLAETDGGAVVEIDPYAGFYTQTAWGLSADFMLSYYNYPSDGDLNYFEATATFTYPLGPLTPKLELNYAPRQAALVDDDGVRGDNFYASAALDYVLPGTPLSLTAQLGYERGAYDYSLDHGKADWSLAARYPAGPATFGLAYIDTNLSVRDEKGRQLAGPAILASLSLAL